MQVDFYHLTARPVEAVLPRIADRVLESGARLLVVSADEAQRERIDGALWTQDKESFLPHGLAGGDHDADQPVLIGADVAAANGASHVALVDGEWRDAALDFDRAFHFFDEASIAVARTAWRALSGREGIEPRYWKQNEQGRWERVA
ncbi:DNA polymerase III subunit chi [Sphingomonas zeicaulis]|uniref:DNA polymerase III subunit chi n=1 Tax=Sphingomonas zeicaulis TaxID=1632740 RepID=UPI003D1920E8